MNIKIFKTDAIVTSGHSKKYMFAVAQPRVARSGSVGRFGFYFEFDIYSLILIKQRNIVN